ncbi:MAG: hypothetical protein IJQ90_03055 [Alphaproteobacteria bacterium]|nr:hypothetical protein [Alphaproteobacteria bacterium]
MKLSRFSRLFCALCLGALVVGVGINTVFADCPVGQYYECGEDPYDNSCSECECVSCPAGQTSDGSGALYYCPNIYPTSPYGDSGCYEPPCSGYDSTCPSYFNYDFRCKELMECPAGSGCAVYAVCNVTTGEIVHQSFVYGQCHTEGDTCYENETDCSSFEMSVDHGAWTCSKSSQTGRAYWFETENAWNTSECRCSVTNKNIDMDIANTVVKCEEANASYSVASADVYRTKKITDSVYYTAERQYCTKCYPGYLPYVETSPLDGLIIAPAGVNSAYGVRVCKNMVSKPYYTPGCDINYPLNNPGSHMCREDCPDNMETVENGATSESDCLPRGVLYEDETGFFKLGTNASLCE